MSEQMKAQVDDTHLRHMVAIVNSMTPQERRFPDIIRGSRKKRIANGCGQQVQAINKVLKQHAQMQKMMKKMGRGGMTQMMKKMSRLQGQLPSGGSRKPPF
jgi:signal recognition particle subunit SRP54